MIAIVPSFVAQKQGLTVENPRFEVLKSEAQKSVPEVASRACRTDGRVSRQWQRKVCTMHLHDVVGDIPCSR